MTEYIDIETAVSYACLKCEYDCRIGHERDECDDIKLLRQKAKEQTADVQEVRHGRIVDSTSPSMKYECSLCRGMFNTMMINYCPFCGAKMDGGGDE